HRAVTLQPAIQRPTGIGRRLLADWLVLGDRGRFGGAACSFGRQALLFRLGTLFGLTLLLFLLRPGLLPLPFLLPFPLLPLPLFGQALLFLALALLLFSQPLARDLSLIHLRLRRLRRRWRCCLHHRLG